MTSSNTKTIESATPTRAAHRSRSWWFDHYQAWQRSGLSKALYCRQAQINEKSFYNWAKKFRDEDTPAPDVDCPTFIPVTLGVESQPTLQLDMGDVTLKISGVISDATLTGWIRAIREAR